MTALIQSLKIRLTQDVSVLDATTLDSAVLANLIHQTFPEEKITLTIAKESIVERETSLSFQAKCLSLLRVNQLTADFLFFVIEDKLDCIIKMTMPQVWDFSWSFPNLPPYLHFGTTIPTLHDSFFYDLNFSTPVTIIFSSYDFQRNQLPQTELQLLDPQLKASEIHLGLNFFVTLALDSLDWLAILIQFAEHGKSTLSGRGFIETVSGGAEIIKLIFPVPFTKRFADTFNVGISELLLFSDRSTEDETASAGIIFIGGLNFEENSLPPRNVELVWPFGSNQLIVQNGEPIPLPGFDSLVNVIPNHLPNQMGDQFPVNVNQFDDLTIRELSIHLSSIVPPEPAFITLSVGPAPGWEAIFLNGAIAIEDILLRWDILLGGGSDNDVEFYVLGRFQIGGGKIDVLAQFPDLIFQGALEAYQTADLSQIFKQLLPQSPVPEIDILDLFISANIKQKQYTFEIDIATDWHIEIGSVSIIPLKFVRINIERADLTCQVTIEGTLNIGGVDVLLLAQNMAQQETGWQFEGSTGRGQAIPIGELINEVATKFGGLPTLPAAITHLEFRNLGVAFNTQNKDFKFVGEAEFPIQEGTASQVDILVNFDIKHQTDGSFTKFFSGSLLVDLVTTLLELEVIFDSKNQVSPQAVQAADGSNNNQGNNGVQNETFLAIYQDKTGIPLQIDALLNIFGLNVNTGLSFTIKEMLLAYHKTSSPTGGEVGAAGQGWLFGIDIEGGLNLSAIHIDELPFVSIPPNQTLRLDFQVLAPSRRFTQTEIDELSTLIPDGRFAFPSKEITQLDLSVTLDFGTGSKAVDLPIGLQTGTGTNGLASPGNNTVSTPQSGSGVATASQDGMRWITLQKQLGPLAFERVGVKYANGEVSALLDASFSAGGLNITLNGLRMTSPISQFNPTFGLDGLGIDFKNASIEIGGTFLKEGNGFAGLAVIKTEALSLSAIGAYAYADDAPSLFIYAVLDYPIGGPAFFYVTGMAAGFGYNRRLVMPGIEQVATFPLVREAGGTAADSGGSGDTPSVLPTDQAGRTNRLQEEIRALSTAIPIDHGQYFLAVGLKFTSFKQIDSFALLAVQFGNRFEIDLLGLSTLKVPAPIGTETVTPVAEAQLALRAVFIPSEGFLGVQAQLTSSSYILSRSCRLTGGFAFYSWFSGEHEGDFVLTLGGYHPAFVVPAHYPTVPRLGFMWQVSNNFYLSGGLYFALTGHALMAGGSLDAVYQSDNIRAWFRAGADFLFAWKPYHYEIEVSVALGLEITVRFFGTHTISLSAEANLKLWGPEFGGEAHVRVKVLVFKIPVDITFGSRATAVPAIAFDEFKQTYLPAKPEEMCGVIIKSGLITTVTENGQEIWIVNAKEMVLVTNSVIPSGKSAVFGQGYDWDGNRPAIQPMGVQIDEVTTTHSVVFEGVSETDLKALVVKPITKRQPAALWGKPQLAESDLIRHVGGQRYLEKPQLNGERFVEDTLTGYEIRVGQPPRAGASQPVSISVLRSEIETAGSVSEWRQFSLADPMGASAWQAATASANLVRNQARDNILAALGMAQLEIDFGEFVTDHVIV